MIRLNTHRTPLLALAICAMPCAVLPGQAPKTADTVYRFIKDSVEHLFPLPKDHDTATVGTFDARTGAFAWRPPLVATPSKAMIAALVRLRANASAVRQRAHKGIGNPGGDPVEQAGEVDLQRQALPVNARDVSILFKIENAGARGAQVTVNGVTYTAPAGQSTITADVKQAVNIEFEVFVVPDPAKPQMHSPTTRSQRFDINHHPYPIAGVYTMQAIPISILFAPPQYGKDSLNRSTKTEGVTVSSSFSTSMSSEKATNSTTPSPTQYDDLMTYKNDVSVISQAFGAFLSLAGLAEGDPDAPKDAPKDNTGKDMKSVAGGLSMLSSLIDKALGSASGSQTTGSMQTTGSSLTVRDVQASNNSATTAKAATPGVGDRISYLHNAKFAYIAYYPCASCDVELRLTPLSAGTPDATTPVLLKDDLGRISGGQAPLSGFSKSTIQFLLGFDPYVDHNDLLALDEIDPERFYREETFPVMQGASDLDWSYTHEVSRQDSRSSVSSTAVALELRPGFLCFLDLGVTTARCDSESSSIKTSTTNSTIRQNTVGKTESWKVHLETADPHVKYYVTGYYDRVLGTFAFSRDTGEAVNGVVRNKAGLPLTNQLVTLSLGGRAIKTRTDSRGQYSFGGRAMKPGQWMLQVEHGPAQPVLIGRQPVVHDIRRDP